MGYDDMPDVVADPLLALFSGTDRLLFGHL